MPRKQRVVATLGRLDQLRENGRLEGLLRSGAKFCESVLLLASHRRGEPVAYFWGDAPGYHG